jgi:hypothetical protein
MAVFLRTQWCSGRMVGYSEVSLLSNPERQPQIPHCVRDDSTLEGSERAIFGFAAEWSPARKLCRCKTAILRHNAVIAYRIGIAFPPFCQGETVCGKTHHSRGMWEDHPSGAKQVAQKRIERSNFSTVDLAEAEARSHLMGLIGPAEAVPLLQSP